MKKFYLSAWKNYAPTILLLAILLVAFLVFFPTERLNTEALPELNIVGGITLIIIGLVAGLLGGLIGTGGCSVMLPAIHFWLGYPAPIAVGTTLFAVVFTAISGGYGHLVRKNLDVKATLWVGTSGIGGVIVGSYMFTLLTSHVSLLGLILGLVFLWPAGRMIWERSIPGKKTAGNGQFDSRTGLGLGNYRNSRWHLDRCSRVGRRLRLGAEFHLSFWGTGLYHHGHVAGNDDSVDSGWRGH
jgi:hypothetical protein